MRFQCTNCMSVVEIADSEMGQPVACGNCQKVVVVPSKRLRGGAVIGDFVIERSIGSGGLAEVYLSHQLSLDRPAALKILYEKFTQDASFIDNFIHEARAAAQLNHPNIVQAFAVGEEDGIYYFAMEYVQGNSLKNVLSHSGRFVTDQALRIAYEIAIALDFAWNNRQLVHRDIKPDNIIITEKKTVKLADLGLAQVQEDLLNDDSNEIFGTPQYVAPEQLLGFPADNRSDIYSLGATLYHLVAGECPFKGKNAAETARKHITEILPNPRNIVSDIPDQVYQLIRVMMSKRPGHRYQSVSELISDLELVREGQYPQACAVKAFETPIDLDNVEKEMAATVTEEQIKEAKSIQKRRNISKQAQSWFSRSGGSSLIESSKTKSKSEKKPAAKKEKPKLKTKSNKEAREQPSGGIEFARQQHETQEQDQGSDRYPKFKLGDDEYSARRRKKKLRKRLVKNQKGLSKAVLTVVITLFILMALAAGAGLLILYYQDELMTKPRFGLSIEETKELNSLEKNIDDSPRDEVLVEIREKLENYPNKNKLRNHLMELAAPLLEEQAREQRSQRREKEWEEWQQKMKQLIADKKAEEEEELREQIAARHEANQKEIERLRNQQRGERRAELQKAKDELRKSTLELAREHNFRIARIEYEVMADSGEEDFETWAENRIEMLKQAEKALNSFRGTGDKLEGASFLPPGEIRPGEIKTIDSTYVITEMTRDVYEAGEFVRQAKRQVSTRIDNLIPQRVVQLIEEAWNSEDGGDPSRLDLMIGSYLLATGQMLDEAKIRLEGARGQLADSLLEEIEEVRAIL